MLGDSERGPDEVQTRSKRGPKCLKQQPLFKSPILKIFSNPPACRRVWLEGVVSCFGSWIVLIPLFSLLLTPTPLLLYSSTPLLLYSSAPLLLYSSTPLLLCSSAPLLLYSSTIFWIFYFPSIQSCRQNRERKSSDLIIRDNRTPFSDVQIPLLQS